MIGAQKMPVGRKTIKEGRKGVKEIGREAVNEGSNELNRVKYKGIKLRHNFTNKI